MSQNDLSPTYSSNAVIDFTSKQEPKRKQNVKEQRNLNVALSMDDIKVIIKSVDDFYLLSNNNDRNLNIYFVRINGKYYKFIDNIKDRKIETIIYEAIVRDDIILKFKSDIFENSNISQVISPGLKKPEYRLLKVFEKSYADYIKFLNKYKAKSHKEKYLKYKLKYLNAKKILNIS